MEDIAKDRVAIRYHILSNLDYLIEESVYYRSFSDDIQVGTKSILYNSLNEDGKVEIT